jgi:hypothetical protein
LIITKDETREIRAAEGMFIDNASEKMLRLKTLAHEIEN